MRLDTLLRCLQSAGLEDQPEVWDSIMARCYESFYSAQETHIAQTYISQMKTTGARIDALIAIGQLREGYKAAVKSKNKVAHVLRIRAAAIHLDKKSTLKKCDEWLQRNAPEYLK